MGSYDDIVTIERKLDTSFADLCLHHNDTTAHDEHGLHDSERTQSN